MGWMNDPQIPPPPKRQRRSMAVLGEGEAVPTRSAQAGHCADRWPSALLPAEDTRFVRKPDIYRPIPVIYSHPRSVCASSPSTPALFSSSP